LKVGLVGPQSFQRLDGGADSTVIDGSGDLSVISGFEVLVIDDQLTDADSSWPKELVDGARAGGTAVVAMRTGRDPNWNGSVDATIAPSGSRAVVGDVPLTPSVDLRRFNPIGYHPIASDSAKIIDLTEIPPRESFVRFVDSARSRAGITEAAEDSTPWDRAEFLITMAAAGVPVISDSKDEELMGLLGNRLSSILREARRADLHDRSRRDRLSVLLRRAAMQEHSRAQTWWHIASSLGIANRVWPTVSVLLASNRPSRILPAIDQMASQTFPIEELIILMHGVDIPAAAIDAIRGLPYPARVVHASANLSFGGTLNLGVAASTGETIAKIDDDDWYGPEYLFDLVLATVYSGASLVGKFSEFVFLEGNDVTITRLDNGAERFDTTDLSGGALLLDRAAGRDIGFWRPVPSFLEDQCLLADILNAGFRTFRTQGYSYLLNRHSDAHAWTVDED
jgi:hypothetical protein